MKKVIPLFLAYIAFGIIGTGPSFAQDWPMFRHDLEHTGYSTSIAPLQTMSSGAGGLETLDLDTLETLYPPPQR